MAPASAAPAPAAGAPQDAVLARLGALAGLAPSSVLLARLRRAAALCAEAEPAPPDIDQPAWAALLDAVTVQETCFFRTPPQWWALRESVLPALLPRATAAGRPLRLLSAGCATGEEAWSLAALGLEAAEALATPGLPPVPVRVLGLDISRPALRAAEAATYHGPPDPLREMPPAYRRFVEQGEAVRPTAAVRRCVHFQRANLLRWEGPAERQDIILCRNVLIYLTEAARRAVLARLAAALRPGGALVLGPLDRPPPGLGLVPWVKDSIGLYRREGTDG